MKDFYLKVLGITQDGGYPHAGCMSKCCKNIWSNLNKKELVSSIALIDDSLKKFWLIDITPDFKEQYNMINPDYKLSGIFLTHAHLGHYIGLLDLGVEVMNLTNIPVYAMPRMKDFLEKNAPINFLIKKNNIRPLIISNNKSIRLNKSISISPFLVPHRNELSETVGYKIESSNKSIIYMPDIDTWENTNLDILDIVNSNDVLFIDGTFYDKSEIKNRDITKIPHPTIKDSLEKFKYLNAEDRDKIYFTHLNHTNNLLRKTSPEFNDVINNGYHVAKTEDCIFV